MQAARLHSVGKPIGIDDVPRPTRGPGQVVIRVEGAGFCRTDLHIISSEIQILPGMPLTLDHENAGTVAAIESWGGRARVIRRQAQASVGAEIIAIDLDDRKVAAARESGATHTINARKPEVQRWIFDVTRASACPLCSISSALPAPAWRWARIRPISGSAHLRSSTGAARTAGVCLNRVLSLRLASGRPIEISESSVR